MKAVVAAFNQEKALVGAFSVIVQPVVEPMEYYTALVQDYDQVEVILQAFHGQPTNCKERKLEELIKSTALDKIVKLNSVNRTHGSFDVDIENITHNVYYCVRVELG